MKYVWTVWNEKVQDIQDISGPDHLRVSDGPHWITVKKPWDKKQKFYEIYDIETGRTSYRPSQEAYIFMNVSQQKFYRYLQKRRNIFLKDRYIVKRIPKFLFIKKTGREKQEIYRYGAMTPRDIFKEDT